MPREKGGEGAERGEMEKEEEDEEGMQSTMLGKKGGEEKERERKERKERDKHTNKQTNKIEWVGFSLGYSRQGFGCFSSSAAVCRALMGMKKTDSSTSSLLFVVRH